ncbi:unnamed protein product [Rotaria sp. Silwood1]|nr:unnamed protein product [Rotaria sp. Silwood1]CAF1623840.1 unnamed protein product [Rotaria sp. Silwood1]CAF3838328.1 unnamed protein product [Rotaria sp. Silwood1]CAF4792433.1 unnamed protein product [Rotaria sp. Silwood1]
MSLPARSEYKNCGAAWVRASNGQVPPNAVPGGQEANGQTLYVARFITKEGQLSPGKLAPQYRQAYVSYGGKEQSSAVYQVLTHPNPQELKWVSTSGNNVPTGALQGGSDHGTPLFIGRAPFQGGVCCGKYAPSHGCVYLPWGEQENSVPNNFEVLCLTKICE